MIIILPFLIIYLLFMLFPSFCAYIAKVFGIGCRKAFLRHDRCTKVLRVPKKALEGKQSFSKFEEFHIAKKRPYYLARSLNKSKLFSFLFSFVLRQCRKPYKADLNCWINCVAVLPEYPP